MSRDKVTITTHQDLLKAFKNINGYCYHPKFNFKRKFDYSAKSKNCGATGKEVINFPKEKSGLLFTKNNEIGNLQIAGATPQSKVIRYHN